MMTNSGGAMRDFRSDIVFAFMLALACYLAWLVRDVLVLLYVSALVCGGAGAAWCARRPASGLAAGSRSRARPFFFCCLAWPAAITAFGFLALPPVIEDLQEFGREMPARLPGFLQKLKASSLAQHLDTADMSSRLQDFASNAATYLLFSIRDWAGKLFEVIMGFDSDRLFHSGRRPRLPVVPFVFSSGAAANGSTGRCSGRRSAWANGCLGRAALC